MARQQGLLTEGSPEEVRFRETVRQFAEQKVRPLVGEMDRSCRLPRTLIDELFRLGVMGIEVPASYGGGGGTFFMAIAAIEELARVDPSVAVCVDVQNVLVNAIFVRCATALQRERYLAPLATNTVAAFAISEAEAGSDAFALTTRARFDGTAYVLNGRKLWTTNGAEAGLYVVFANADPDRQRKGITAFVVERGAAGFSVGKSEEKLGLRASSTCELVLDDVRLPPEQVLGRVGGGQAIALDALNSGRIGIGAQMVGLAQGALEAALAYSQERRQFGQRIASFQGVQFPLAEMATEIQAARLMVYQAARLKEGGAPFLLLLQQAAMAKYFASQMAERVASRALEIFGGYGFTKDYPAEKFYRDAKVGKIYEGTSNMQLKTIATTLLDTQQ